MHGEVSPGEFLPVAQRGGLQRELDLWVLRSAVTEAATWPRTGQAVAVAVNLAGLLPADPSFLADVTAIVEGAGLPWNQLVLELVETSLVALPRPALDAMSELVHRGVRFAVDDFGTGYSSLARLKELPAQTVKVDRAFVTGVGTDPADFALARAVVEVARAMGRKTVAEGVETAEQFHVLRGLGVDAFQGWLFARSLRPADLHRVLRGGGLPTPATSATRPRGPRTSGEPVAPAHRGRDRRRHRTNALCPVTAFPTISVFISRVPSKENIASASAKYFAIRFSSTTPLPPTSWRPIATVSRIRVAQNSFTSDECASEPRPWSSSWALRTAIPSEALTLPSIRTSRSCISWNPPIGRPNCSRCAA